MSKPDIREEFIADVANHRMEVLLDRSFHRHLKFSAKGSSIYWFELVTWPGSLAINGDMGSWTFSRVRDMFTFFRGKEINPGYWAEKIRHGAGGSNNSAKGFSEDALRIQVASYLDNWELSARDRSCILKELEDEVFCHGDQQHDAIEALFGFEHATAEGVDIRFDPVDGPFGMEWTYHFLWCLWAIVWGIQQYDEWFAENLTGHPIKESA